MAIDIGSLYSNQSSTDQYIDQMMRIESRPRDALALKLDSLYDRKKLLSDLDSKLSGLSTIMERLTDPITDFFAAKLATSSDSDLFTVTAGATAELGNHSLSVDRLAISDTRVSQQYTDTDSSFGGFNSDQTFSIEVAHPTDEDASNRVEISVTIDAGVFAGTNDDVLQAISNAINSAMSSAAADETIENDEEVNVNVVTEEDGTSRLVFRSEKSGYNHRMEFTDSADNLLQTLEVNSGSQSAGTSGGYITTVGDSQSNSMLNARFTMDGLTYYRSSNNVTDAMNGVTIQLLDSFDTDETIAVNTDTDTVKEEIQGFLDSFNEVLKFVKDNAQINPTTHKRGLLADDVTYKNIVNQLREYARSEVAVTNADYSRIFNIGIEADSSGMLSIADLEKFTEAIESNSLYVSDIFNADDGIAVQIHDYIDNFVKTGGTIDNGKENITNQVMNLSNRISLKDEMLYRREMQLRNEFATLQQAMARVSNQQSFLGMFNRQ
ncbi:MAG: flagellar filament capping protein FliD [Calditrichaeota bacterium]|jgi:flagellar hook-associated protein 2|nr:flagellar filament capping protein FliD [Calditrichota bacterium]